MRLGGGYVPYSQSWMWDACLPGKLDPILQNSWATPRPPRLGTTAALGIPASTSGRVSPSGRRGPGLGSIEWAASRENFGFRRHLKCCLTEWSRQGGDLYV